MSQVLLIHGNAMHLPLRDASGRFLKGTHWRPPQSFREKEWLIAEYVVKQRSTGEIAAEFGVSDAAIFFWLGKHKIPRRTMHEVRQVKYWGAEGAANGMYGRHGAANPNWKGGETPERQSFYASGAWKTAAKIVWQRDAAMCQHCQHLAGKRGGKGFHIHHIVTFAMIALRAEPSNLVLLCRACHRWVHSKQNTEGLWMSTILTAEEPY